MNGLERWDRLTQCFTIPLQTASHACIVQILSLRWFVVAMVSFSLGCIFGFLVGVALQGISVIVNK